MPLPTDGRDVVALELSDRLQQAALALQLRARRDVLPAQQEAHEVLRGDRLDLGAQAVERVAVDARQQAAVAPLLVAVADAEAPAHRHAAFALQERQGRADRALRQARAVGKFAHGRWAEHLEVSADDRTPRLIFAGLAAQLRRQVDPRPDGRPRVKALDQRQVLDGEPEALAAGLERRRAAQCH